MKPLRIFLVKGRLGYSILSVLLLGVCVTNIGLSFLDPTTQNQTGVIHPTTTWLWDNLRDSYTNSYYFDTDFDNSIDIISIGTTKRPYHQYAQENTFIKHSSVRNFYRFNELNDTERTCHTDLTQGQFDAIRHFCTRRDDQQSRIVTLFSSSPGKLNFKPKNATGWLCAQKRPIDGLYFTLRPYINSRSRRTVQDRNLDGVTGNVSSVPSIRRKLPKYLLMIDDDTYVNMTFMTQILSQQYPYNEPHLLTGCLLQFNKHILFQFPFGGYASILSRTVLERMIQPIYCKTKQTSIEGSMLSNDPFNRRACSRLQENLIGELIYFRDGMSVLELMYTFSSALQFTKIDATNGGWINGTGFCFHSDHALGYFFGYYYVGVPDRVWNNPLRTTDARKERGYSYNVLSKEFPTCFNNRWDCGNSTTICHYNTPEQMYLLYQNEHIDDNNSTPSG